MNSDHGVRRALIAGDPAVIGTVRLTGRLGAGGMSTVYVGDLADHGEVAVKVIAPHLSGDEEYRRRLRREVDALRRVSNPRVAPLIDADVDGPEPWLVMTYLAGPTLHARVAGRGPLPAAEAAAVADELAEGLVALHQVGVVHRDLTPANVILTGNGAVIVDLGIARLGGGAPLTRTGTTLGTPAWMAPEQLTGAPVGPAADVFAWGGVVTFAATGRAPFGDGDPAAMGYRIVHTRPELGGLGRELGPVVAAALAPDPADRPAAATLRMVLAGEIDVATLAAAPTRVAPPPVPDDARSVGDAEPPPLTTVARNRSTSTPSIAWPRRARRGPYRPWVVLGVIVSVCIVLVLALVASGPWVVLGVVLAVCLVLIAALLASGG